MSRGREAKTASPTTGMPMGTAKSKYASPRGSLRVRVRVPVHCYNHTSKCVCVAECVPVCAVHVLDALNCFCMRRFTAVFKLLRLLRLQATCTALKLQLGPHLPPSCTPPSTRNLMLQMCQVWQIKCCGKVSFSCI